MKMNNKSVRSLLFTASAFALLSLTSCGKYNFNKQLEAEDKKELEYVFGDVDGPPRQAANQYPADPEAAAKADALKQKLFSK